MPTNRKTSPADDMPEIDLTSGRFRRVGRGRLAGTTPAVTLQTMRDIQRHTQKDVSAASGIAQSEISKLEAREDEEVLVSTLRRYVEGIGGTLNLVVRLGDRSFVVAPRSTHVETTAAFLRERRKEAGVSLEELGKRMNMPAASIEDFESGREELSSRFVQKYMSGLRGPL